jgi:hypothetical protein
MPDWVFFIQVLVGWLMCSVCVSIAFGRWFRWLERQ